MRTPKKYYSFEVNGVEYKARLTRGAIAKLEGKTGKPLMALFDDEEGDILALFDNIVWASFQPFVDELYGGKWTIEDTQNLFDEMVDEGKTLDEIMALLFEIMSASGFQIDLEAVEEELDADIKN